MLSIRDLLKHCTRDCTAACRELLPEVAKPMRAILREPCFVGCELCEKGISMAAIRQHVARINVYRSTDKLS